MLLIILLVRGIENPDILLFRLILHIYYSEIMNCLHNYVVNDTPAFLSQPDRLEIVFEMCKHVSDKSES